MDKLGNLVSEFMEFSAESKRFQATRSQRCQDLAFSIYHFAWYVTLHARGYIADSWLTHPPLTCIMCDHEDRNGPMVWLPARCHPSSSVSPIPAEITPQSFYVGWACAPSICQG